MSDGPYRLYRYYDARNTLLYVGISGALAARDSGHISKSKWMQFTSRSTVERHKTLEGVKKAERSAIRAEHPIFNKAYNSTPEAKERLRVYLEAAAHSGSAVTSARTPGRPLTRSECGSAGVTARLLSEDWNEMTSAAFASANHVSSLDRWTRKALEANPRLTDEQAERMGEMLRTEHYRKMGRLSVAARWKAQS